MKKVLFVFALTGFLFSCSSSSSPEAAAEGFLENMAHGDFEKAKKYATDAAASLLDMAKMMPESDRKLFPDYNFKFVSKTVDGDNAVVTFITPDGKEDTIDLKKVDGEWKVYIKK